MSALIPIQYICCFAFSCTLLEERWPLCRWCRYSSCNSPGMTNLGPFRSRPSSVDSSSLNEASSQSPERCVRLNCNWQFPVIVLKRSVVGFSYERFNLLKGLNLLLLSMKYVVFFKHCPKRLCVV